jgi:hypothetical protein
MFEFISKKIANIKILHEGYTADYFRNRMKPNALFPILFIQNNLKKKSGTDIFYQIIAHVHFREILSGYFLFSLKLTKMSLFTPTYRRIELFVKVTGWNRNKMSYFETN